MSAFRDALNVIYLQRHRFWCPTCDMVGAITRPEAVDDADLRCPNGHLVMRATGDEPTLPGDPVGARIAPDLNLPGHDSHQQQPTEHGR